MYIPDLRNLSTDRRTEVLAVGWLDKDAPFPTFGHADLNLAESAKKWMKLTIERGFSVVRTRGVHRCNLCRDKSYGSNASVLLPTRSDHTFFLTNYLLPHYME